MTWDMSFSTRLPITETPYGLSFSVRFSAAGQEIEENGILDLGAAFCVIPRITGENLGLAVEAGVPTTLRTGGGPMATYQHYGSLILGDLLFEDVPICVAKYHDFDRVLIGRAGWLHKVRLGLVVYDELLYLNLYSQ
jgi:predicted aspartyl protease